MQVFTEEFDKSRNVWNPLSAISTGALQHYSGRIGEAAGVLSLCFYMHCISAKFYSAVQIYTMTFLYCIVMSKVRFKNESVLNVDL